MMKKNKGKLLLSSLLTLLPIPVGLLLWDKLPGQFATHWGADGQADGFMGKPMAIFLLPAILLVMQWVCLLTTAADKGNKHQSPKVFNMVIWIIPMLSVLCSGFIYAAALGWSFKVTALLSITMGLMFMLIGNYMPKCRLNRTIGIKLPWTLSNEENWNATHRFAGWVWMVGGAITLLCMFLPGMVGILVTLALVIVLAVIPMVYSWCYYKKQRKAGLAAVKSSPASKWGLLIGLVIFILAFWFTGSGRIETEFQETALCVETNRWEDLTVEYAAIDAVEYREEMVVSTRTNGFGGFRVMLGIFENEEFGTHARYTYNHSESCIIITAGERILVLSGKDSEATKAIYQELLTRTEG